MDALDQVDEIRIVIIPGFIDPVSHDLALSHCERRGDRVAILDGPPPDAFPDDLSLLTRRTDPESPTPTPTPTPTQPTRFRPRASRYGFGAYYVPHLIVPDRSNPGATVISPPCGHIAGVYARNDLTHGVHRAPAGAHVPLRGVVGLTNELSRADIDQLNPHNVNTLISRPGRPVQVWGSRTLSDDPEWRYMSVRRLVCMVEESIRASTSWAASETNDQPLWDAIERSIGGFLFQLWRGGQLKGETPEYAFFVRCDETTNPPAERDSGSATAQIGIAALRPAEFVILRFVYPCRRPTAIEQVLRRISPGIPSRLRRLRRWRWRGRS